jgi:hypothetical protein
VALREPGGRRPTGEGEAAWGPAQPEIEIAVRQELAAGNLRGNESLDATATVAVRGLPHEVVVPGEIRPS